MIDTVRVFEEGNFFLPKKNNFKKQITIDSLGEIKSEKMFYHSKDKSNTELQIKGNTLFATIHSLPKALFVSSFCEVGENDKDRTFEYLCKILKEAGLVFCENKIPDLQVSRVDFCRNLVVDSNRFDYLFYLSRFKMKNRVSRNIKSETLYFKKQVSGVDILQ